MSKYNKAIAAFIGAVLSFAAVEWGLSVSPEIEMSIVTAVTTILTWAVPNKQSE